MICEHNDITADRREYVRELQQNLRTIEQDRQGYATLTADGFYGEATVAAVRQFQQQEGLPDTGKTDRLTWDTVCLVCREIRCAAQAPIPIDGYRNGQEAPEAQSTGDSVWFLQVILRALAARYRNLLSVQPTGVYDEETVLAVQTAQKILGLPQDGITDKTTWNAVVRLYNEL